MRSTGFDISVRVHDITVAYNDLGPDTGNTLIFIHGFPFNKSTWDEQMRFLSSWYRCIAYDIRGFGHSTANSEELTIGQFADDLDGFMDILQINKAVICGLSMGGYIALHAIKKYPIRFSGIVLCNTQCYADDPDAKEKRKKSIELIRNNGKEKYVSAFINNIFPGETIVKKTDLKKNISGIMMDARDTTLINTLRGLAEREETCSALKNIGVPCLIVCGEADQITPVELSEYLHEHIKNSVLEIIPGCGHLSNMEAADAFNEIIRNFIYTKFRRS